MRAAPVLQGVDSVLCLGAHCDDVEIGCGGTLLTLARANPGLTVHVTVFSGDSARVAESREALARLLGPGAKLEFQACGLRDGFLPAEWPEVKERVEALKSRLQPDIVFTHHERDRHQDHRTVCELTWNSFRNHLVLEYEIPKWDGDLGQPSAFVPLGGEIVDEKVRVLLDCFASQRQRSWFTPELFRSLLRLRGMECNAPSGYAEAFYVRKWVLG